MSEIPSIDYDQPIALFPLPHCVLLPGATIPLHIFEHRYRRMTGDAIDDLGLMAMALFEGDDWRQDYQGKPALRPNVCVGYILHHERYGDGRFDLLMQGLHRSRIVQEIPHDPYRMAILEPIDDEPSMEIDLIDQRQRLDDLLKDRLLSQLASVSALKNSVSREMPTSMLIDLAVMAVCEDTEDRYAMLTEAQAQRRFTFLDQFLTRTRRTLELSEPFRPRPSAEDAPLN